MIKLLKTSLSIFCLIIISSCSIYPQSEVSIINKSSSSITNMSVIFGTNRVYGKMMSIGQEEKITAWPTEGALRLVYTVDSVERDVVLGYVTPGIALACYVKIEDEYEDVSCKAKND